MSSIVNHQSLFNKQNVRRLQIMKQKNTKSLKSDENTPLSSRSQHYLRQKSVHQYPPANEVSTEFSQEKEIKEEYESFSDQKLLLSEIRSQVSPINNAEINDFATVEFSEVRSGSPILDDYSSLTPLDESEDHRIDSEYAPSISDEQEDLFIPNSDCSSPTHFSNAENLDQDFEEDKRKPDPGRRKLFPTGRRYTPDKNISSPTNCAETNITLDWANLPTCHDDEAEESSQPTFAEISSKAKKIAALSKSTSSGVQTRVPWSHNDEQLLLNGIEKYGCSWSCLSSLLHGWDRKRDQVALKDKARNMKVSFLKAGVPLPLNFNRVRLGKKEIASVKTVIPDYEPDE